MRRGAMVVVILGIAAASAAMWDRYAPPNACLFCAAPEHYDTALNVAPDAAAGMARTAEAPRRGQYAPANSSSIPGPDVASRDASGSHRTGSDARRLWAPWSTSSGAYRYGSSDRSAPSVGIGGLWRLMTLAHRAPEAVAVSAPRAPHAEPAARPAPKPHTGAPAARPPAAPAIVAVPMPITAPFPTNPFGPPDAPPVNPFIPPPPSGPLDPGGPGGGGPPGAGPSATPEPASLLLIGTGLLVLAGELRRRRVI